MEAISLFDLVAEEQLTYKKYMATANIKDILKSTDEKVGSDHNDKVKELLAKEKVKINHDEIKIFIYNNSIWNLYGLGSASESTKEEIKKEIASINVDNNYLNNVIEIIIKHDCNYRIKGEQ